MKKMTRCGATAARITTRGVTLAAVGPLLVAALLLIGCENAVKSGAPAKVSGPSPRHNATGVSHDTDLKWTEVSDATGYRVYFGTDSSPKFKRDQKGTTFDPGTLKAQNDLLLAGRLPE